MTETAKVLPLPESPERKRRKLILIITGSVVLLSLAAVLVLSFTPLLAAKHVQVTGTTLVDGEQLGERLAVLEGTPLPRISESMVQDLVGEQPAIDELVVRAQMPDTLVVEVIEAEPVAILVDGEARHLVSSDGRKLKNLGEDEEYKLPTIAASERTEDPEAFQLLTGILSTIDTEVIEQISSATLTQADFVELALPKKRSLIWGDENKPALKNQVAKIFLEELDSSENPPKVIDISNPENPVTY
ncbi:FtsQ-type POTRA domain-containing protein [Glutamicibacter sp. MNS18]|uniref:cell division protein FtsQ/DivIB n=1 Tax=Glutamicibacter sp. MNS18 TaxID=2989817 RepID=UPI002235E90F|nr:FtsQ-type POTRA domain-containing protein [Glutamicibacter sp. MNS18]MCW4464420.1 FtsQ-type POTRA domain-containing protein [Glutamicibacter sp. MNS18]